MTTLAIVFATILGPILAVWASEIRQQRRQFRDRKEWVFRTLMSTRGAKLRSEHVEAINNIEFAFPRKSCISVEDARSLYRKHLRHPDSISQDQATSQAWARKLNDLFAELLYQMSLDLKIPFSKSEITEESYHPDAYIFDELMSKQIKMLTLEVLKNERSIQIYPDFKEENMRQLFIGKHIFDKFAKDKENEEKEKK